MIKGTTYAQISSGSILSFKNRPSVSEWCPIEISSVLHTQIVLSDRDLESVYTQALGPNPSATKLIPQFSPWVIFIDSNVV